MRGFELYDPVLAMFSETKQNTSQLTGLIDQCQKKYYALFMTPDSFWTAFSDKWNDQ